MFQISAKGPPLSEIWILPYFADFFKFRLSNPAQGTL